MASFCSSHTLSKEALHLRHPHLIYSQSFLYPSHVSPLRSPPLVFIPMSFIPHVAGPMLPYTPLFLYFLSPLICSGHHSGTCQCSDQSRLASRLARHRCAATSLQEVVKFRGSDSHIDRRLFNRRPFSTKGGESPLPEAPWQPRLSALWRVEPSTSLQRGTPPRREDGLVLLPS